MKYESSILKRLIDTYGVVGNPRYLSEIIKEFIVRGKELYPQLFTYQSDWLAHIDEFGLTAEYTVSYTGQHIYAPNTKEKPVKSAILSGQTLVNLANVPKSSSLISNANLKLNPTYIKPSTTYTIFINMKTLNTSKTLQIGSLNESMVNASLGNFTLSLGVNKIKITTRVDTVNLRIVNANSFGGETVELSDVMIIEGDYTNVDIPYFEGMQSVKLPVLKATGKNLFDLTGKVIYSENNLHQTQNNEVIMENTTYGYYNCRIQYFNLKPNERYIISYNREVLSGTPYERVMIQDENRNTLDDGTGAFTAPLNGKIQILFYSGSSNKMGKIRYYNIQLEESTQATTYEPFNSNILSTSEDVVLRGIGDVQDMLDCLTGEVVGRVGEIVLDGSEDEVWVSSRQITINGVAYGQYYLTSLVIPSNNYIGATAVPTLLCDKGVTDPFNGLWMGGSIKTISMRELNGKYHLCMNFPLNEDIKLWLQQNHMTLYYQLEKESIKTVGLTIHDKDQQKVERLTSFEGGTHFTTSSQDGSLLPTIAVDVVTDLEETLTVCSLEGNTM